MKSTPEKHFDESLTSEIIAFWVRARIRYHGTKVQSRGKKKLADYIKTTFIDSILRDGGQIHIQRDSKKELKAVILIKSGSLMPDHRPKTPYTSFCIFTQPGDRKSLKWAADQLVLQKNILQQGTNGIIDSWQSSIIPSLRAIGIHASSIILKAEVVPALRRLKNHYGESLLEPLKKHGLTFTPAKNLNEVEGYLKVIRTEFTRNPQFGTFVADPTHMKMLRAELTSSVKAKQNKLWVIRRGNKVLGGADYSSVAPDINGKMRSGFGVNLASELQGKKIARCIYAGMLTEFQRKKIILFRGGTAQPGVMRLARVLNRRLDGIVVESAKKPLFPKNHFKGWF